MSRQAYGTSNINFGTFDNWANNISSDSNTKLSTSQNDMHPARSAPFSVSTIRSQTIFKGKIWAGTGGTVAVTAPYSVSATSSSIVVKNFFINQSNITIVATASYPWTFNSWRTGAGGGGSTISTSATFTFGNSSDADFANYYAYFTTTHIDPNN